MARISLPSTPGGRDIFRKEPMTWRIPGQRCTPGEMPRPLEKPCLQLGSEQQGSARGRLARAGGCPWAHPSRALTSRQQLDTGALQGQAGVPGEPRGLKKSQLQQQVAGNPSKAPGQDQTWLLQWISAQGPKTQREHRTHQWTSAGTLQP